MRDALPLSLKVRNSASHVKPKAVVTVMNFVFLPLPLPLPLPLSLAHSPSFSSFTSLPVLLTAGTVNMVRHRRQSSRSSFSSVHTLRGCFGFSSKQQTLAPPERPVPVPDGKISQQSVSISETLHAPSPMPPALYLASTNQVNPLLTIIVRLGRQCHCLEAHL